MKFLSRCGVTLPIAFTLCPLLFVLLVGSGEGPVSGLDAVLVYWAALFFLQFRAIIYWPVPLAIGLIAAGLWHWIAKRTSARRVALSGRQ